MLTNCLAACTHLSSTVSQLFEPQVQKIAVFRYCSPHFCFPWRRPCDYHAICWMKERQFNACQTPRSMYPSIFNSFPVIQSASAKNCRFQVLQPTFLFPLVTPLPLSHIHTIRCMDQKTIQCLPNPSPRSMYLSILNSFRVIRCLIQCTTPKIVIFTTLFVYPGYAPGAITLNVVWMERQIPCLQIVSLHVPI